MRTITCPLHLSKGSCNALVHCRELFMLPHTRYPSQHIFWWMVRLCADKAFPVCIISVQQPAPAMAKGHRSRQVQGVPDDACLRINRSFASVMLAKGLRRSPYTISLIKLTECTMISGLAKSNLPQVHYGRGIGSMGMHLLILDREYVIFTTINE